MEVSLSTKDGHPHPIYSAIGKAMSAWAAVEDVTFLLFSQVLGVAEPIGMKIFYAFNSFGAKLSITNDVFLVVYENTPEAAYWQSLHNLLKDISRERNFVAHNPLLVGIRGDTKGSAPPEPYIEQVNAS